MAMHGEEAMPAMDIFVYISIYIHIYLSLCVLPPAHIITRTRSEHALMHDLYVVATRTYVARRRS
jgi:hypothetical protein